MATRGNTDPPVRPPLLDRLVDYEPKSAADSGLTRAESVAVLKAAVLRDLGWLLNTRRTAQPVPDACAEVRNSVFLFGLPDTTAISADSESEKRRLLGQVEEAVRRFEPRLANVRVRAGRTAERGNRQIRFIIEGELRLDPGTERVTFDTTLEGASGRFIVTEPGHA